MSLLSIIKGRRGPSGFGYASTAEEVTAGLDLTGKHILITGVGSGLGWESARVLASRGATILAAARTETKAAEACRGFGRNAVPLACELSDPGSVRACVETVQRSGTILDAILCNAGIMALPRRELRCGQELQFLTNHVGHFLLVTGLLGRLAPNGRVVLLSSDAHTMAPKSGILNNMIEQDHRGVKSRINPMLGFKVFDRAAVTIAGVELLHRVRKGQFNLGRLLVRGQAAPAIWHAVLSA